MKNMRGLEGVGIVLVADGMKTYQRNISSYAEGGFDQWGYNYTARIFNGPFGYVVENRPGFGAPFRK